MSKALDLTGQTFGRITVSHRSPIGTPAKKAIWIGRCTCGNEVTVVGSALVNGHTRSCGCLQRDIVIAMNEPIRCLFPDERQAWKGMLQRCYNPKNPGYKNYGGRGITVAIEWHDLATFLKHMAPKPGPSYTIERKNNNLGYSKENCVWATRHTQSRNTRQNHVITVDGETRCFTDWAKKLGVTRKTLRDRLARGWSEQRAYTTPPRRV